MQTVLKVLNLCVLHYLTRVCNDVCRNCVSTNYFQWDWTGWPPNGCTVLRFTEHGNSKDIVLRRVSTTQAKYGRWTVNITVLFYLPGTVINRNFFEIKIISVRRTNAINRITHVRTDDFKSLRRYLLLRLICSVTCPECVPVRSFIVRIICTLISNNNNNNNKTI